MKKTIIALALLAAGSVHAAETFIAVSPSKFSTAFFSVFGFSQVGHVWQHHALLISFFSSLWQVGLLTLIIVNIARQSA